mmetsp:Transcript_17461/g.34846  ORF Transcript_17461/g.34846 Transcript_17461/m.34846 type:complete len:293 (-) Transcript_17461:267-1145(-)|eukprot:CAMPEP_0113379940 /NCGR_PEP_ID=MMETSP0013_2-20120614/4495_1 /TAXON_ID=2843 ORGANISM="Skeletonema costatum, Strain 1716" /NCGR_SAMPLE_ID=MMETSP0013_2 /ASSEMBLY_ACC=CAM_ASM_000158 /LENGTH=292 /DNA_ID=CAMNT_0000262251 /DNA_START=79 /DNA_END=957 /DNA_ORIENTATION=- /assembly_acc=CAM_ASM_000158
MAQSLTSRMSRLAISTRNIFTSSLSISKPNPSPILSSCSLRTPLMHTNILRSLSTIPKQQLQQTRTIDITNNSPDFGATSTLPPLLHSQRDAENFAAFVHANKHHKVKPFILKRRRHHLKSYIGNEKNIRHSPWRMNLVCQFAHGLTVPEALKQLMFCQKVKAPLVAKVIRRTANLADIRDGFQPSQLEVSECFTTHGTHLKRLKIMGRGRSGKKLRRFSHIRLVLREIDFPTKILEATSINQKRKWLERLAIAREDYEKARVEKEELEELERLAAEVAEKQRKEKEAESAK